MVSVHIVNLPVGLFAFIEVRFYNDRSTAICFYGYQQAFIFLLSQPEKAMHREKTAVSHSQILIYAETCK